MHRFGASLNRHVHFHCGVLDGVFEGGSGSDGLVQFRPASACGLRARAAVAAPVRGRVLRWFARRGPIERDDVREVLLLLSLIREPPANLGRAVPPVIW